MKGAGTNISFVFEFKKFLTKFFHEAISLSRGEVVVRVTNHVYIFI